jgi:hypothetical protein
MTKKEIEAKMAEIRSMAIKVERQTKKRVVKARAPLKNNY